MKFGIRMKNESVTEKREYYVGGTDIKEILAQENYASAYAFAKSKLGLKLSTFQGNKYTMYGELMEPILRDFINSILDTNFQPTCIIDEQRRFRGNLDGIDRDKKLVLEVKTYGNNLDLRKYYDQVQFYLELSGYDACVLALYIRPESFYSGITYSINNSECYFDTTFYADNLILERVERDKNYFNKVAPTIKRFQYALDILRTRPDMTKEEFNKLFYGQKMVNKINEMKILQTKINDYKKWVNKLEKHKQAIYEKFENLGIKAYAGDGIKVHKVNPSEINRIELDIKKLSQQMPDIFEKYKIVNKEKNEGNVRLTIR